MANLFGFDATQVPEQAEFGAIPAGDYVVIAIASEEKPTKKGDGSYVQFTFEVVDGAFKGRKIFSRLNLNNPNPVAMEIAQKELGAFCRAVGIMKPTDSSELHNKPILVTVDVEVDERKRTNNNIKKYKSVSSAGGGFSNNVHPAAMAQQASATASPPWAK